MRNVLIHPVAVLALALLILNDRVLKGAYGNAVTGKLSDVTGLIVFPLVLQSLVDHGVTLAGRRPIPLRRTLIPLLVFTAALFSGVQLFDVVTNAYDGFITAIWHPAKSTQDPTDLFALPALAVAWWVAHQAEKPQRRSRIRITRGSGSATKANRTG